MGSSQAIRQADICPQYRISHPTCRAISGQNAAATAAPRPSLVTARPQEETSSPLVNSSRAQSTSENTAQNPITAAATIRMNSAWNLSISTKRRYSA